MKIDDGYIIYSDLRELSDNLIDDVQNKMNNIKTISEMKEKFGILPFEPVRDVSGNLIGVRFIGIVPFKNYKAILNIAGQFGEEPYDELLSFIKESINYIKPEDKGYAERVVVNIENFLEKKDRIARRINSVLRRNLI